MHVILGAAPCMWGLCYSDITFTITLYIRNVDKNIAYQQQVFQDGCVLVCGKNYYTNVIGQVSFYKYNGNYYSYEVKIHATASAYFGASADGWVQGDINYILLE